MKKSAVLLLLSLPVLTRAESTTNRLNAAATVLSEIMSTPDKGIPTNLLSKAQCIVIVPGLKSAAFVVGAKYGKGFVSCRKGTGWSAPAALRVEGGSVGFQIGGIETDVVMLVMNSKGSHRLLGDQFTIGGEGQAAIGPIGRATTAQTDPTFRAEILSWSRARGVFAGVSVQGATLRQDLDDNMDMYGQRLKSKEIIYGNVQWPQTGSELNSTLNRFAARARRQLKRRN